MMRTALWPVAYLAPALALAFSLFEQEPPPPAASPRQLPCP